MKIVNQPLPGVMLLEPRTFTDARGRFVKTFHAPDFASLGIAFNPLEEFYSVSHRGVLRGMHFQLPPHDHAKLVYCVRGRVLDVLLDLRRASPDYGRAVSAELSEENCRIFYIPPGIAHGFLALEDHSLMVYKTTSVHAPTHDAGIRWDGFGFDWGAGEKIISERDRGFPALRDFVSPF